MYKEGDFSTSPLFVGLSLAGILLVYGSAVPGLLISGLRAGRIGRTGAEDKEPTVDIAVAGLVILDKEAGFIGVAEGSADPGRSGRFFPATFTRFCAAIVSLMDGLVGTEVVLLENMWTLPPVAVLEFSNSFWGFGFEGSSISNFCCFESRADNMLSKISAHIVYSKIWFTCISDLSDHRRAKAQ